MKHRYMIIVYGVDGDRYHLQFFDHLEDAMRVAELADSCSYEWELYKYYNSKEYRGYKRYR